MMKTIRYLSAGLVLLFCIWNLYLGIKSFTDPGFIIHTVIAILYFILGVLVLSKIRMASWIAFLAPLAVLFIYPVITDFKDLNPWSSGLMGAIDAIIVICGLLLLLIRVKG